MENTISRVIIVGIILLYVSVSFVMMYYYSKKDKKKNDEK